MKKNRPHLLLCALAASLVSISSLHAEGLDELVAKLRVEVDKSVAEAKASKTSGTASTYQLDQSLGRLESAIARENLEEADQALTQLAVARLTIEAKGLINQLQREVPKAAEERQKALVTQVGAAIEKAGKACLAAKTETDLDAALADLGALRQRRADSSSDQRQRLNARLDSVIRFVTRWQEFLAQKSRGYESTARGILRDLADPSSSSGNQYYPLVARDEIIARLGKDSTPDDILRAIKNLDDLPKVIAEIQRLNREDMRRSSAYDASTPINDLTNLAKAHAAFKAGSYGTALQIAAQIGGVSGAASGEIIRLKTLLLAEILPRHLELPDNPQPKAGENPSDFLLRLAAEGAAQDDWSRVARALDAFRATAYGFHQAPAWVAADLDACQSFVTGQNLEKAGRFAPAVLAYQRAVKSAGKYSPHQRAAARLSALEKDQPAAFTEATKDAPLREILEALRPATPGASTPRILELEGLR